MNKVILSALATVILCPNIKSQTQKPNIIFILADDMGYGDVSSYNENSKISTPNIDQMVEDGVSFFDAHTSSSVSTPTRYGVLTGRYNWRSRLKRGVLNGYSKALIPNSRTTIASLLKRNGYTTGCIGKWHLGWNWYFSTPPKDLTTMQSVGKGVIDYTKPIQNGPTSVGFDYFYGFCGSLDMPPYVYVENDKVTALPNRETVNQGMGFWRKGPTGSNFIHEETLPHIVDQAVSYIEEKSKGDKPFFLYLPLPAPHTPILPTGEWINKSGLNPYGDFVMMVDHEVGRVLEAVKRLNIDENTLIVFTSDNGCSPQAKYNELQKKGHNPSYIYRGHKADLFEGGHRVPCVVQWKGTLKSGKRDETICLTDFFSTFADITGGKVEDSEGEDSFSLCPLLFNKNEKFSRETTIHHSITGEFAIRKGDWKLLVSPSSGGWSKPTPKEASTMDLPPMQLYNIKKDPEEKKNVYAEHKVIVQELLTQLRTEIKEGRSTKGSFQPNELDGAWVQLDYVFRDCEKDK